MSKKNDPTLFESRFERREGDRYFTHAWMTRALLRHLDAPRYGGYWWEPAAGRGDIVRVLRDAGARVLASDVDMSDFGPELAEAIDWEVSTRDFLRADHLPEGVDVIVTNPPYFKASVDGRYCSMAEHFVRRALELGPTLFAVLTRTEFASGKRRADLFDDKTFAAEVRLRDRPRWDWWFRDEPEASPRHYYSWYIWRRDFDGESPTILFDGMQDDDRYEPVEADLLEDMR